MEIGEKVKITVIAEKYEGLGGSVFLCGYSRINGSEKTAFQMRRMNDSF